MLHVPVALATIPAQGRAKRIAPLHGDSEIKGSFKELAGNKDPLVHPRNDPRFRDRDVSFIVPNDNGAQQVELRFTAQIPSSLSSLPVAQQQILPNLSELRPGKPPTPPAPRRHCAM